MCARRSNPARWSACSTIGARRSPDHFCITRAVVSRRRRSPPSWPLLRSGESGDGESPAHDPEKWVPVFPRDKRGTRLRGDHAQTKDKRDDVSSSPSLPRPLFQCGHSMDIAVLLLSMCLFFAVGMPIAFAMALAALTGALWIDLPVAAVMQQLASGVGKVSMLTIPFFVLAGAIMAEGGMAKRLVDFAAVVVGFTRMRGGLSQVNILATTIMSGISGSSVADTSAIGSVMIPQMAAKGYPRVFATNVTISASLQAIIIPPSHNSVIYSLATGGVVSITSLFLAGLVLGLLLGLSLMLL